MESEQREPMELRALQSLGLGFDLTSDFRMRFAKGYPNRRLVELDEVNTGDLFSSSLQVSLFVGCLEISAVIRESGFGFAPMYWSLVRCLNFQPEVLNTGKSSFGLF